VQGDPADALALFEQEPLDWMRRTGRSLALHALGRRQEADAAFDELIRLDGTNASYQQAQVAAQRGDADLAFKLLDQAIDVQDLGVSRVLIDPLLDPIRADPRFRKVVEREGLLPFMDKDTAAET
jgi:tetratricopeptide (TPR) repeat protein